MATNTNNLSSPEFSVIITCYEEEQTIQEFHHRLTRTMQSVERPFEILMVNDGSKDATFEKLEEIYEQDPYVTTVIDLFRNTGQICAMSAGIAHARGEHFIFMDSDLQLDAEELPLLIAEFDRGFDIVSGYRKNRRDPWLRKLPSRLANILMQKLSGHLLNDFGCTFKVYHGNLVRAFSFGPYKAWKTAYVFAHAKRVKEVPVSHHPRRHGESGWTFRKLSGFLVDHIVGILYRAFQALSIVCLLLSSLIFLRLSLAWAIPISILPRITSGFIVNSLLVHLLIVLAVLAIIGEYVVRTFIGSTRDPLYVIRRILQKHNTAQVSTDGRH